MRYNHSGIPRPEATDPHLKRKGTPLSAESAPVEYPNRWWILASVMAVMIMAPLDSSVVNIILPVIQQDFHVPLEHLGLVAWVPLAYLIVIGGFILPMGRLGDLWGFRRLFLSGVVLFMIASALCGFAAGLGWLIGARVLQAVGACMMMALSPGITAAIFPARERGRALGIFGMGIAIGLAVGPSLGGFLANALGWWGSARGCFRRRTTTLS